MTLADNFTSTGGITHSAGTFTANDQTISALSYASSTSVVKDLRLGASQVTVNGSWSVASGSNLTVTPGTSLITVNANSFNGNGQPFNDVVINSASSVISLSGGNTFRNLQLVV